MGQLGAWPAGGSSAAQAADDLALRLACRYQQLASPHGTSEASTPRTTSGGALPEQRAPAGPEAEAEMEVEEQ
jgi:hypothetical protein